mmetsp:Transcript_98700/g.277521  ORF Transcript_98700/g.277521 Transcript_98700/m.277521 type:complete len:201 (-) Transcript_98700:234-836(-)
MCPSWREPSNLGTRSLCLQVCSIRLHHARCCPQGAELAKLLHYAILGAMTLQSSRELHGQHPDPHTVVWGDDLDRGCAQGDLKSTAFPHLLHPILDLPTLESQVRPLCLETARPQLDHGLKTCTSACVFAHLHRKRRTGYHARTSGRPLEKPQCGSQQRLAKLHGNSDRGRSCDSPKRVTPWPQQGGWRAVIRGIERQRR